MRLLLRLKKINSRKFCLIFILCASLSACGIRPGTLEYPTSQDDTPFPQTYPAAENVK